MSFPHAPIIVEYALSKPRSNANKSRFVARHESSVPRPCLEAAHCTRRRSFHAHIVARRINCGGLAAAMFTHHSGARSQPVLMRIFLIPLMLMVAVVVALALMST